MPDISLREVETQPHPDTAIIWLHGLGADGNDFVPIVQELDLGDEIGMRFIFPDAPLRPVSCNGGHVMRAWYDIISLEPDSREIDEGGLIESIDIVQKLIKREVDRGIPSQRIFLAGFSQGGAVAYSAALRHPATLAGVVALSTYIPSARLVSENLSAANRRIPIFAAHGQADSVVSLALGKQAIALIEAHGYTPEWHTYAIEHEVCLEEIKAIGDWLRTRIAAQETAPVPPRQVRQDCSTVSAYDHADTRLLADEPGIAE